MEPLAPYGWNEYFASRWEEMAMPHCIPARVLADYGSMLKIVTPDEKQAEISGRLLYFADNADLPKVGDWVAAQLDGENGAVIEAVLPRQSEIARKIAGQKTQKQVMAANIDIAFILQALDNDFSPERLQRYMYQLGTDNIAATVVLNKADQAADIEPYLEAMRKLDLPYVVCSALTGDGVDAVAAAILPGHTAVLLGSSGVGKSTLTNKLLGREAQLTKEVRAIDSKGQHTTTHREIFMLASGGLLMDTPGIRELQLWGTEDELDENFDDVAELASQCRFSSCSHTSEPGCAIQAALQDGTLARAHYDNYLKMKQELQRLEVKANAVAQRQNKRPFINTSARPHRKKKK